MALLMKLLGFFLPTFQNLSHILNLPHCSVQGDELGLGGGLGIFYVQNCYEIIDGIKTISEFLLVNQPLYEGTKINTSSKAIQILRQMFINYYFSNSIENGP